MALKCRGVSSSIVCKALNKGISNLSHQCKFATIEHAGHSARLRYLKPFGVHSRKTGEISIDLQGLIPSFLCLCIHLVSLFLEVSRNVLGLIIPKRQQSIRLTYEFILLLCQQMRDETVLAEVKTEAEIENLHETHCLKTSHQPKYRGHLVLSTILSPLKLRGE